MKPIQIKRFSKLTMMTLLTLSSTAGYANIACITHCLANRLDSFTLTCPHWYVGGAIGYSRLHDDPTPNTVNSVDQNGPGFAVDVGYQFSSLFGAELGYTQYHRSRETSGAFTNAQTEHYAVYLAATGRYPIMCQLSAFAKLGAAYSYANKIYTLGASASAGAVSPYLGLGLAYSVTRTVDFVAQWGGVRGNDYTGSSELYSLGINMAIV